jgi:hypothetical protein
LLGGGRGMFLYLLLHLLLIFLVVVDPSSTFIICYLWVSLGVVTFYWLTTISLKDCFNPFLVRWAKEVGGYCSSGASSIYSSSMATRVIPLAYIILHPFHHLTQLVWSNWVLFIFFSHVAP